MTPEQAIQFSTLSRISPLENECEENDDTVWANPVPHPEYIPFNKPTIFSYGVQLQDVPKNRFFRYNPKNIRIDKDFIQNGLTQVSFQLLTHQVCFIDRPNSTIGLHFKCHSQRNDGNRVIHSY